MMNKESILHRLRQVKTRYREEGLIIQGLFGSYSPNEADDQSDVDILIEATPEFAEKYGFKAIARFKEIENELSRYLGIKVDLTDRTGLSRTGKKFIIDRAIDV